MKKKTYSLLAVAVASSAPVLTGSTYPPRQTSRQTICSRMRPVFKARWPVVTAIWKIKPMARTWRGISLRNWCSVMTMVVRHSLDRASMSTTIRTPIIPRASSPTSGTRCMRPLLTSTTWLPVWTKRPRGNHYPRIVELMKGEALALRAFLHFDLLRMYGPVYKEEPEKECIPLPQRNSNRRLLRCWARAKCWNWCLPIWKRQIPVWHKTPSTGATMLKTPSKHTGDTVWTNMPPRHYRQGCCSTAEARKDLAEAGRINKRGSSAVMGLKVVRDNFQDIAMFDETLLPLHMDDMEDRLESYFNVSAADDGSALWITPTNAEGAFEVTSSVGRNDIRY